MLSYRVLGSVLLIPVLLTGGVIDYTISIDPSDIHTEKSLGYDRVYIEGYGHVETQGHPQLPMKHFSFVIPPDAEVSAVGIVRKEGTQLQGVYRIFPAQKPVPVSLMYTAGFTPPDNVVYSSDELFPGEIASFVYDGSLSGYRIATVAVYPVQYNPHAQQLYLNTQIHIRIEYQRGIHAVPAVSELQKQTAGNRVKTLVENPEAVDVFAPAVRRGTWDSEYIIITTPSFANAFEPLKEWKTRRGVPTDIVTTTWIYSNYSGNDNTERIRNFISAAADSGVLYFLLGGQCDFEHGEEYVPRRDTYFYTSGVGYYTDEDTLPCDMYFSNLDGNWNSNGNGIYGEMSDNVDFYADVFVGRAPVKNTTQIANFISKVITYEKAPTLSYVEKILLPVGNLWSGNYGNGINDTIADTIPNDWQKSKLYESNGLMSRWITRDSLDQGFNFCHYVGHGNEYGEYYNFGSNTYYSHSDPGTQSNDSSEAAIAASMGCFCGGLDQAGGSANYDCMAERMVNVNKRCAVATIMNSRYGWGYSSPQGNLGPSGELSVWFFRKLFGTSAYHIGEALAAAKDQKASQGDTWWWRWCLFEYNLFGDPEMPVWTDSPGTLIVTYSSDTAAVFGDSNPDTFVVTVQDSRAPVANALVTIMQDSTAYLRASTNASGQAQFIMPDNTFQHAGYAWVTVTHYSGNYLPDCDSAEIIQGPVYAEELQPDRFAQYSFSIQPNPAKRYINVSLGIPARNRIRVNVYDIQGSLVHSEWIENGTSELRLSTAHLSSGVYIVKTCGDVSVQEKIILLK
jgi:hypothetical protein